MRVGYTYDLTTRHLLECASTIDEVLLEGKERTETWEAVRHFGRRKLHQPVYGWPGEIAEDIVGGPLDILQTILALIDWALNPPLPMLQPSLRWAWWRELYPPARFVDAARVVATRYPKLGVFRSTRDGYKDFRNELRAAGLRYGDVEVDLQPDMPVHFPAAEVGIDAFYIPLLMASSTLLAEREYNPDLIISRSRTYIARSMDPDDDPDEEKARFTRWLTAFYPFVNVHRRRSNAARV